VNVIKMRSYHDTVSDELKVVYKSVSVLFMDSFEDAFDSQGRVLDETALQAHKRYGEAMSGLGEAIDKLDQTRKLI
jgi:hypothetical protein